MGLNIDKKCGFCYKRKKQIGIKNARKKEKKTFP